MLALRGRGRFNDVDVADVVKLAMAGLIQQPANPRRLFALPTGCSGDPEPQSRSWLRSSVCHRELMLLPSNLLPRFDACLQTRRSGEFHM